MALTNQMIQTIASLQKMNGLKPGVRKVKTPTWRFPLQWQREYQGRLIDLIERSQDLYKKIVLSQTEQLFRDRDINRDGLRLDDSLDDLERFSATYSTELERIKDNAIQEAIEGIPGGINDFNLQQWRKIIRAKLGIDLFQAEPWLANQLKSWAIQNVTLINNVLDDQLKNLNTTVLRNYSQGKRHTAMIDDIQGVLNSSRNRAKLIARDQTNKLNGDLMRERQTSLGLTYYFWRDSDDERVRPSHLEFDGKRYSWEKGGPEGNPGEPIQCRCWADPDFEELDNELKKIE